MEYDNHRQQFRKKKKAVESTIAKEGHEYDFLVKDLQEAEKILVDSESDLIRINEIIEQEFARFEMHRVTDFSDCFDILAALEKEENKKVLDGLLAMDNVPT